MQHVYRLGKPRYDNHTILDRSMNAQLNAARSDVTHGLPISRLPAALKLPELPASSTTLRFGSGAKIRERRTAPREWLFRLRVRIRYPDETPTHEYRSLI